MNILYTACVMLFSLTLMGCDQAQSIANQDISNNAEIQKLVADPAQLTQMYGEVVHEGRVAEHVKIGGVKMSPDIMALNIVVPDKRDPMILSFICDRRMEAWALSHTLTKDGQGPKDVTEISILNYRKGLTTIREADETNPIWSTANGDNNIATGLMAITKLDPNSTVAIVLDRQGEDGYYDGEVWSYLLPVSQVTEQLKLVDLSICMKSALPANESPEIMYTSMDDVRKAAKAGQLR